MTQRQGDALRNCHGRRFEPSNRHAPLPACPSSCKALYLTILLNVAEKDDGHPGDVESAVRPSEEGYPRAPQARTHAGRRHRRLTLVELSERAGITAVNLSVLKNAGLVRDYREGKYIFYELKATVLEETLLWIANLKEQAE